MSEREDKEDLLQALHLIKDALALWKKTKTPLLDPHHPNLKELDKYYHILQNINLDSIDTVDNVDSITEKRSNSHKDNYSYCGHDHEAITGGTYVVNDVVSQDDRPPGSDEVASVVSAPSSYDPNPQSLATYNTNQSYSTEQGLAYTTESNNDGDDDVEIEEVEGFANFKTKTMNSINWNEEFQNTLKLDDSLEKFKKIASLARDFVFIASTYGRIIISEHFIDDMSKTVRPADKLGGTAGGKKYICQNILFKFALDVPFPNGRYLYGGGMENLEKAMKAASNELKGLSAFSQTYFPGIHFPLMSVIHHRGFCLTAVSILPIGKDSLRYGSNDGGSSVFSDESLTETMAAVGKLLNLDSHLVHNTSIYGPGDIEIHLGGDNRFYAVDLARLMPPEAPLKGGATNAIFYNLFRPTFVQKYNIPLCSDAFSGWLKTDPNKQKLSQNVQEATEFLYNSIPELAQKLQRLKAKNPSLSQDDIITHIHRYGVNCRHLGNILSYVTSKDLKKQLLLECIARTIKNEIREKLRQKMRELKIATEDPYKEVAFNYLKDRFLSLPKKPTSFLPSGKHRITFISRRNIHFQNIQPLPTEPCTLQADVPIFSSSYYFEVLLINGRYCKIGIGAKDNISTYNYFYSCGGEVATPQKEGKILSWANGDCVGLFYNSTADLVIFTRNGRVVSEFYKVPRVGYIPLIIVGEATSVEYNLGTEEFKFRINTLCKELSLPPAVEEEPPHILSFWRDPSQLKFQMQNRFPECLTSHENSNDVDLRSLVDLHSLVSRFSKLSGVSFSQRLLNVKAGERFVILDSDIEALHSRTKHTGVVDHASAVETLFKCEAEISSIDAELNLLSVADLKLSGVIGQTNHVHLRDYYYWGSIWWEIGRRKTENKRKCFDLALKKFNKVLSQNDEALKLWKDTYALWFKGGINTIICKTSFKCAVIMIEFKNYSEAVFNMKRAYTSDPQLTKDLISLQLSKIYKKLLNSSDGEEIHTSYKEAMIYNEAVGTFALIDIIIPYIKIIATAINKIHHNAGSEGWIENENVKTLFTEIKNSCLQLLSLPYEPNDKFANHLEQFLFGCVSEDSLDGMFLAVFLKLCNNDKVLSDIMIKILEGLSELRITHNFNNLLVKESDSFIATCKSKHIANIFENSRDITILQSDIQLDQFWNEQGKIRRGVLRNQKVIVCLLKDHEVNCSSVINLVKNIKNRSCIVPTIMAVCFEYEHEMMVYESFPYSDLLSTAITKFESNLNESRKEESPPKRTVPVPTQEITLLGKRGSVNAQVPARPASSPEPTVSSSASRPPARPTTTPEPSLFATTGSFRPARPSTTPEPKKDPPSRPSTTPTPDLLSSSKSEASQPPPRPQTNPDRSNSRTTESLPYRLSSTKNSLPPGRPMPVPIKSSNPSTTMVHRKLETNIRRSFLTRIYVARVIFAFLEEMLLAEITFNCLRCDMFMVDSNWNIYCVDYTQSKRISEFSNKNLALKHTNGIFGKFIDEMFPKHAHPELASPILATLKLMCSPNNLPDFEKTYEQFQLFIDETMNKNYSKLYFPPALIHGMDWGLLTLLGLAPVINYSLQAFRALTEHTFFSYNGRRLHLAAGSIQPHQAEILASAILSTPQWELFSISDNVIGTKGVQVILDAQKLSTVHILALSNTGMTSEILDFLISYLNEKKVSMLNISNNNLSCDEATQLRLAQAICAPGLLSLNIAETHIKFTENFVKLIRTNKIRLSFLDISGNEVESDAILALSDYLVDPSCVLNSLILKNCNISKRALSKLFGKLKTNTSLTYLNVLGNTAQKLDQKIIESIKGNRITRLDIEGDDMPRESYTKIFSSMRDKNVKPTPLCLPLTLIPPAIRILCVGPPYVTSALLHTLHNYLPTYPNPLPEKCEPYNLASFHYSGRNIPHISFIQAPEDRSSLEATPADIILVCFSAYQKSNRKLQPYFPSLYLKLATTPAVLFGLDSWSLVRPEREILNPSSQLVKVLMRNLRSQEELPEPKIMKLESCHDREDFLFRLLYEFFRLRIV